MIRLFEGLKHAESYARFRPKSPLQVAEKTIDYMKVISNGLDSNGRYGCMVDVGCGSGQSTEVFSPFFKNIFGFDPSASQINVARSSNIHSNIKYSVGFAESLQLQPACVDLLTCGQALHWMDFEKFFSESHRVLRPDGCLLLHGYDKPLISQSSLVDTTADALFTTFYKESKAHPRRYHLEDQYDKIFHMFTSDHKQRDQVIVKTSCVLSHFIEYLKTLSGYKAFLKFYGMSEFNNFNEASRDDILVQFINNLKSHWKVEEDENLVKVNLTYIIFMIMSTRPHS